MTTEDQGGAESAGSRTFNVEVDGTSLTVTVTPADDAEKAQPAAPGGQSFRIAVDGRGFCVQVESGTSNAAESTINVPPAVRTPQRSAPATAPKPVSTQAASTTAAGETALTAPIPGTVVRYTVSEAQQVKAGETVVVLEAMKMENILRAEKKGKVSKVNVSAGDSLAVDDVIIEFE